MVFIIGYSVKEYAFTAYALCGLFIAGSMRLVERAQHLESQQPTVSIFSIPLINLPPSVELMASTAMTISQQRSEGGGVSLFLAIVDFAVESAEFVSG